jgi:hypothetical protein
MAFTILPKNQNTNKKIRLIEIKTENNSICDFFDKLFLRYYALKLLSNLNESETHSRSQSPTNNTTPQNVFEAQFPVKKIDEMKKGLKNIEKDLGQLVEKLQLTVRKNYCRFFEVNEELIDEVILT